MSEVILTAVPTQPDSGQLTAEVQARVNDLVEMITHLLRVSHVPEVQLDVLTRHLRVAITTLIQYAVLDTELRVRQQCRDDIQGIAAQVETLLRELQEAENARSEPR